MKKSFMYLKKSLSIALAMMCACILLSTSVFGQIYQTISWDDYAANSNVPYCTCDYIKCAPPVGVTNITWFASGAPETYISDTLVLENGFSGTVNCFYDGGDKYLKLRPLAVPISPLFEDLDLCTLTTVLDAGNVSSYGFTSYSWSNGASSQTIVAGPGIYSVNISNLCGSVVSDDVVITYTNPNRPDMYEDQEFCFGETGTLDPHVSFPVSTLWSTGATTDELIVDESGTYSVYVLDENGCDGRDTINVTVNYPVDIEMHDVSFDTTTNKNIQRWCVDPMQTDITYVRGEFFDNLGVWTEIETVPYEQGYIIHYGSMPQGEAYEYRLIAIGECGESAPSPIHKSIWLSRLTDEIQWQNYFGYTPDYYEVFARKTNNTIEQLGTRSPCSTDGCLIHFPIINDPDIVQYFIGFEHNCGAKNGVQYVFSNYYDPISGLATQEVVDFTIFPNPAADQLELSTENSIFEVRILTPLGQVVLFEHNTKVLDVSNLTSGVYIVSISADGVTTNRRFVKQ